MSMPQAGDLAPEVALPDEHGMIHQLSERRGGWTVVYFYPADDTPGCTTEACQFRDLHDEDRMGRMRVAVVRAGARRDRDIRFRCRIVGQADRHLGPDDPAGWQSGAQGVVDRADGGCMVAALGLGDDQLPAEQLDRLAAERAELDQTLVSGPCPAVWGQRKLGHARRLPRAEQPVNVARKIRRFEGAQTTVGAARYAQEL